MAHLQSTLTEIHREAKRVFRPVKNGHTVQVLEHGKSVALIVPDYPVVTMSAEQFQALDIPEAELKRAVNAAIEESRR